MLFSRIINLFTNVHKRHLIPDIVVVCASIYLSLFLRVGVDQAGDFMADLHKYAPIILGVRILVFVLTGIYSILWRYVSTADVLKVTKSVVISTGIILSISIFMQGHYAYVPRSLFFIESALTLIGMLGIRIVRRVKFERRHFEQIRHGQRTLIYGAGYNGKTLADRFSYDANEATHLIGFIDDDPDKQGLSIGGTKVLGDFNNLSDLIRQYSIKNVIIASTSIPGSRIREIIQLLTPFNIKPRIITRRTTGDNQDPSLIDRDIKLSDLLNRPPTSVDIKSIHNMIKGKRVLITGAGGSIGSEISRQVYEHSPSRLILLDHSEFNLYQIDRELRTATLENDQVTPLLVDLKDRETLFNRLQELSPEVVIHAAAYKHVHLVEANPYSAILNNVGGTLNLIEYCAENNCERFVLISSDKAVNPAGVMGATKRVCEQIVAEYAQITGKPYCSVRFGNVLGSSGSLIPLFKEQIRSGGPVTVTHKDMTRYFMLIPEAVSLVLKAATIAQPGDINVLKMGQPVKILEVAKNLIALMGKKEHEIEIMFTGLRPGEKMYEELYFSGDELKTEHPDILTVPENKGQFEGALLKEVNSMITLASQTDKESILVLNNLVRSTYVAPEDIRTESEKASKFINAYDSNVTKIH